MMEDIERKQQKKKEMQDAGAKTAHVAGKAAATYFGGTLGNVAYDKISQTKLGQKIEQGAGKIISKVPGVNKLNKKLNDTGAIDAAEKATDLIGGKGKNLPSKAAGKAVGKTAGKNAGKKLAKPSKLGKGGQKPNDGNVKKALANRRQNSFKQNFLSRKKQQEKKKQEDGDSTDINDNDVREIGQPSPAVKRRLRIILIKKIIVFLLIPLLFIIILLVIISAIASAISSIGSFFSLKSNNSEQKDYVNTETDINVLRAEQRLNDAIVGSEDGSVKGVIADYRESYSVTLDKYTIIGVLTYAPTSIDLDTTSQEKSVSDYENAYDNISTVAQMMLIDNGDGTYSTDVKRGGAFYNTLIESDFIKTYYKNGLAVDDLENRTKLVDDIFDYIEFGREVVTDSANGNGILGETTEVFLQTCDVAYKYTTINGIQIFDNPLVNEGTSYPASVSFTDYLKGIIEGEVGSYMKEEYREGIKAMMVAATSFMLGDSRTGFDLRTGKLYYPTGNCRQVSCNPVYGCNYKTKTYILKGETKKFGTAYVGAGNHQPLTEAENELLDDILLEVFGEVMVKKGVTADTFTGTKDVTGGNYYNTTAIKDCGYRCLGQKEAFADAKNGMNYKVILAKYYDETTFDIINIKEGLYVEDASYSDAQYDGNVIFYDQGNYKNVNFCGRSNASISSSGCGVTATAIIISSLTGNKSYDPVYMMNLAHSYGDCGPGIVGTNAGFFRKAANKFGFDYKSVGRSQGSQVIEALKSGNSMVIAHMGQGHFTSGGHYIVLSAVNSSGKVYVHDPNNNGNKRKRSTGNGWYDLNMIASELKSEFYIITKR